MGKLYVHDNKILKLNNVLKHKITITQEDLDLNLVIGQMHSYIKAKGAVQIGPLVQYTSTFSNEAGELEMELVMMLQCKNFIHNVEYPYLMDAVLRVSNAMYCRYNGPEPNLKYAYEKIHIEAFEQDILLEDESYIIFVSSSDEEETIVADVFIPRKERG